MTQIEAGRGNPRSGNESNAAPSDRLRVITLSRGDVWPEREMCELILVLSCRTAGFNMEDLPGPLCPGELALLPLGNELMSSAKGQVLSASMERIPAPSATQRLRDRLIEQLLRRAWASSYTCREVIGPALALIETLANARMRERQEKLDFLERLDPRIAAAVDFVDAHYGEEITVPDLASVACLSPGHFARAFKTGLGQSVWTYVQRRRCEAAREMLLETTAPIATIAHECGFSSQAHLTSAFRNQFNKTPGALRQTTSHQPFANNCEGKEG